MKFSEEIITEELLEEVKPLLYKHWEEISHYKDIPLDPDYTAYLFLQKTGAIKSYSVRENDGKLIGYAVYFLRHHVHYKKTLYAIQDIVFIDPERRGSGLFLIKFCDEELKKIGVNIVMHHIKIKHDWSKALERLGYERQDIILTKRLQ